MLSNVILDIKKNYPCGTAIKLVSMNDSYSSIPKGTFGVVHHVDDIGTIHVHWENGRSLGIVYNEDVIEIVQ